MQNSKYNDSITFTLSHILLHAVRVSEVKHQKFVKKKRQINFGINFSVRPTF